MDIKNNIQHLRQKVHDAEQRYYRLPGSVTILTASKQQPVSAIRTCLQTGLSHFGENYVQEALPKIQQLSLELPQEVPIEWHFIGKLQSNKTPLVAQYFSWVHSIDRLSIAQRLNAQRPAYLPRLNICISVNITGEINKSGIHWHEVAALAQTLSSLPRLQLRGLMTIPKPTDSFEEQLSIYQKLADIKNDLNAQGIYLDTLSMGMSHDFEAAIAAGSTMIRIGTAIFGPRV